MCRCSFGVPAGFRIQNVQVVLQNIVFQLRLHILTHEFFICFTHPQYTTGQTTIVPTNPNPQYILIRIATYLLTNYYRKSENFKPSIVFGIYLLNIGKNCSIDGVRLVQQKTMEEFSLEVKGELQQIFKVLSKQQHDKMPFQGIEIAKSLSRLPFFKRFFDTNSEHFINLCIAQDAIIIPQATSMYSKQINEGRQRYIYVVLEGSFSCTSEESMKKQLGILRIFGQTEILFGLEGRKEAVVALEESKVMRIKESAILKIFNMRDDIKKCLHFMDVNEYFQDLTKLQKMQLTLSMVRLPFEKGSVLKSEGDKFDQVFFFIYGKVEVTTHITKKGKDKEYVIDNLQELSTFGEYESVTGIGTLLKLKGLIAGAYFALNYSQIKKEGHRIAHIIEENAIPYPNNEQLTFLEGVKSSLRSEEKRVIKNLNLHH